MDKRLGKHGRQGGEGVKGLLIAKKAQITKRVIN